MREVLVQSLIWEHSQAMEQLSPCTTTAEPVLDSLLVPSTDTHVPRACGPQQGKPSQREARVLPLDGCSRSPELGKSQNSNKDSARPKLNTIIKKCITSQAIPF